MGLKLSRRRDRGLLSAAMVAVELCASGGLLARDCNGNRRDDRADIEIGASDDCNGNLVPDECDVSRSEFGLTSLGDAIRMGIAPQTIVAEDFSGDGRPDLLVANSGESTATLLLNGGSGRFSSRTLRSGRAPRSIIAADINGDRRPDAILTSSLTKIITILVNTGDTLALQDGFAVLETPAAAIASDFDGDGDVDLAFAQPFAIAVFSNDGRGSFTRSLSVPVGQNPIAVVAADFDGDGAPDLATANSVGAGVTVRSVSILLNDGRGDFSPPTNAVVEPGVSALVADDLDGDGDIDLVAMSRESAGVSVLVNAGNGRFRSLPHHSSSSAPIAITTGDLDRDGDPDIVIANAESASVAVLLNDGDGAVEATLRFGGGVGLGSDIDGVAVADFDGDRDLDVATTKSSSGYVSILLNEPGQASMDCDGDREPDECEDDLDRLRPSCRDCNRNGFADGRDLELAMSEDDNGNGVPDECDGDGIFVLGLRGPSRFQGPPGAPVRAEAEVVLRTFGLRPGGPGVQSWTALLDARGCDVAAATLAGTDAERVLDDAEQGVRGPPRQSERRRL